MTKQYDNINFRNLMKKMIDRKWKKGKIPEKWDEHQEKE